VRVGAACDGYGALPVKGTGLELIDQSAYVIVHPVIDCGRLNRFGNLLAIFIPSPYSYHQVPRHVIRCAFVGFAEESHHVTDRELFLRFYRKRKFFHLHRQLKFRGKGVQYEEFADGVGFTRADHPVELERLLSVPVTELFCLFPEVG